MNLKGRTTPAMLRVAAMILSAALGSAAMACPEGSDMRKGIEVIAISPQGETNTYTFRTTAPGRVDELRVSQRLSASNIAQRELRAGILPTRQSVVSAPSGKRFLENATYSYPGQNIRSFRVTPKSAFTITSVKTGEDGNSLSATTAYTVEQFQWKFLGRCRYKVSEITAIERSDDGETVRDYLFFLDFGFAVELEATGANDRFKQIITEIKTAKR